MEGVLCCLVTYVHIVDIAYCANGCLFRIDGHFKCANPVFGGLISELKLDSGSTVPSLGSAILIFCGETTVVLQTGGRDLDKFTKN